MPYHVPADRPREPERVRRRQDEMNGVGDQTIGPTRHAIDLATFTQEIAVEIEVAGFDKQRLPAISALRDVMRNVGDDDARLTGHRKTLAEAVYLYN